MIGELLPGAAHPALYALLGALVIGFLQGRARMALMIAVPLLGLWNLFLLPADFVQEIEFLGLPLVLSEMTKLSFVFGLLFHLGMLVSGVFALGVEDRMQTVPSLLYPASAIGAVFAGDWLTLFACWEVLAVSSVFFIWARRTDRAIAAGQRYLVQQIISGLLILAGVALRSGAGADLEVGWFGSLTEELAAGGAGAILILLGVGVKCAFPLLHTWLVDGYPEGTATGSVYLSGFTTKVAVCTLVRTFAGAEALVLIGGVMAIFPIIYAVIENDLRKTLGYSMINQIGFMVVGIGFGDAWGVNGAVAHAFNDVFFKGLLFMSMGAVLLRTGRTGGHELGGLYKSMPQTTLLCCVGAASISAFPLFSGFVSKSLIMVSAYENHSTVIYFLLLLASTGVVKHAGIKIPFFAFFAHDSKLRVEEAPLHMRVGMGLSALLCVGIGCGGFLYLYQLLPLAFPETPHQYTWGHVAEQMQILFFASLAFTWLFVKGIYPPEIPSTNLDADWLPRKLWRGINAVIVGPFARGAGRCDALLLDRLPRRVAATHPIAAAEERMGLNWRISAPTVIVMIALLGFLILNYARR